MYQKLHIKKTEVKTVGYKGGEVTRFPPVLLDEGSDFAAAAWARSFGAAAAVRAHKKRFCMARGLAPIIERSGRTQTNRCANVFVYLGPAAQTQLLIRYSRSEKEASGLQAFTSP